VEGSNTDSASGMSNWDNAWQRPANPDTSVAGMALQTCKAYWYNRGPKGFGRGHLVSDTLVERPSSGEERKWGRCRRLGTGAMGNGLLCRETRRRDWR
jgi:hypothetical protein